MKRMSQRDPNGAGSALGAGVRWLKLVALATVLSWPSLASANRTVRASDATRAVLPHYEIAYAANHALCTGLLRVYNKLLTDALQRRKAAGWTDFEAQRPQAFRQAGLTIPRVLGEMQLSGTNAGVTFYRTAADSGHSANIVGLLDVFLGSWSLVSFAAILNDNYEWNKLPGDDAINDVLPFRRGQVQAVLMQSLTDKQARAGMRGNYYLTHWPHFARLFGRFEAREWKTPLPALGGIGPMIRPFEYGHAELYFLIDGFATLHQVRNLHPQSPDSSTIVAERFARGQFRDVCYLVLAPSALASTLSKPATYK